MKHENTLRAQNFPRMFLIGCHLITRHFTVSLSLHVKLGGGLNKTMVSLQAFLSFFPRAPKFPLPLLKPATQAKIEEPYGTATVGDSPRA